jgi:hypothetical protein
MRPSDGSSVIVPRGLRPIRMDTRQLLRVAERAAVVVGALLLVGSIRDAAALDGLPVADLSPAAFALGFAAGAGRSYLDGRARRAALVALGAVVFAGLAVAPPEAEPGVTAALALVAVLLAVNWLARNAQQARVDD